MELSARPAITAGVALATAGMIAATPVLPADPEVSVPDIQLAADYFFSDTLEDWMQGFNNFLVAGLLGANQGLVDAQVGLEMAIAQPFGDLLGSPDSILNGIPNRLFNVFNMGLGATQSSLLGVLGADFTSGGTPSTDGITASLLVGLGDANVFNNGQIGGLEGMFVQGMQAFANLTGIPGNSMMDGLESGLINLNKGLVDAFTGFNEALKAGQLGLENMLFGNTSALNGAVNRGFDAFNMLLGAGQQGFLGLLGADFSSEAITKSLILVPENIGPFADGSVGGLEGVLGNSYLVLADLLGLLTNPADLFANIPFFGMFDPADIVSVLTALF